MTSIIIRDFNGFVFTFRADGWFNMTKAAQHFGKRLDNFLASPETREYLDALKSLESREYVEANRGRYGGTWAHPKLAVPFARWLDVRFAVCCDAVIEDILKGAAELVVVKPQESAVVDIPQDYATALRALADSWERDPKRIGLTY